MALTVLLGSLQAHDWHEGHEGQKSRAQVCLGTGGRRLEEGGSGGASAKRLGVASPRRVAAKGVMAAWVNVADQRAVRAAATLSWRMVGACLARAGARLLMCRWPTGFLPNWFPPQRGKPFAMTSIRRFSMRWTVGMLRSESRVCVVTLAPASLQTRAAARSNGVPLLRRSRSSLHANGGPVLGCRRNVRISQLLFSYGKLYKLKH